MRTCRSGYVRVERTAVNIGGRRPAVVMATPVRQVAATLSSLRVPSVAGRRHGAAHRRAAPTSACGRSLLASVTFENVSKHFDEVVAVDALDLAIGDGEFMVLLGPSGCGKTTALRMIAGLEDITDGVVNDVDPARRDVSMVFQSYALYPHMTVQRNIESPLLNRRYHADGPDSSLRKLTRSERDERVAEAARVLGLEPYLKRKPAALSGGQRQRVALARAFVGRPKAFLM